MHSLPSPACPVSQMPPIQRMAPVHQSTSLLLHGSKLLTRVVTFWPVASAAGPSPSPTSWRSSSISRAAAGPETKPLTPAPRPPHLPTEHSSTSPAPSWGRGSSSWGEGRPGTEPGGRSPRWRRSSAKQVSAWGSRRRQVANWWLCFLFCFIYFFQPPSSFNNCPPPPLPLPSPPPSPAH